MCDRESSSMQSSGLSALMREAFPGGRRAPELEVRSGSRRQRLWELPAETHCPVVGVCLPLAVLRKLISKALGTRADADDYEFHVAAVGECGCRRPIAELLQRELDRRYAPAIRRYAQAKTTPALAALWEQALSGSAVAEALWATLTHPRCDDLLRQKVCHDIHMFQHQAGAYARADLQRLVTLEAENQALEGALSAVKERLAHDRQQHDVETTGLNAQLAHTRGRLIAREAETVQLRAQLSLLEGSVPSLPARIELMQQVERQHLHIQELERERAHWKRHAQQLEDRARTFAASVQLRHDTAAPPAPGYQIGTTLRDKSILCVGGRQATIPIYRQMIECSGARFLHHDGGEENNAAQLEAGLAAADLVICQTGCVSHGAYWRVKDYCKRSGKQCVFVEKPSASSLARCLRGLNDAGAETEGR